jgi:RNA recognition motif-containing protein
MSIPLNQQKRPQGFAYVEFEKFKDYQDALDMKRGTILGREVQIFRSDR